MHENNKADEGHAVPGPQPEMSEAWEQNDGAANYSTGDPIVEEGPLEDAIEPAQEGEGAEIPDAEGGVGDGQLQEDQVLFHLTLLPLGMPSPKLISFPKLQTG